MINVIGLGYIGLPTSLILAANGQDVIGTDYNEELVTILRNGNTTFKEDGLDELFSKAIDSGIKFTTQYQKTDTYIITVPTPYDKKSKKIDPKFVISAVESVVKNCLSETVIVIESTVSPGTINKYIRPIVDKENASTNKNIQLAHAPERIIPGNMLYELKNNNRTIGTDNDKVGQLLKSIYSSFCNGEIVLTDIRTAEMTKVVENTFRDINIAYANELARICDSDGLDVHEIIKIANKHPRVNILTPGPGVGGHCISVDPWFLVGDYPELANLIRSAREVNDSMPSYVLERMLEIMKEKDITDISKVGVYGLTYKANIDDTRESPTLQFMEAIQDHKTNSLIGVYDPFISKDMVEGQYHNLDEFIDKSELIILMVDHDEIIENMDKLENKIVLDTKNVCHFDGVYHL